MTGRWWLRVGASSAYRAKGSWGASASGKRWEMSVLSLWVSSQTSHAQYINADVSIYNIDFKPVAGVDQNPQGVGLVEIDHLTNNVYRGRMDHWAGFYERLFNFREIRYFDIEGKLTGLKSKAMTSPCMARENTRLQKMNQGFPLSKKNCQHPALIRMSNTMAQTPKDPMAGSFSN